MEASNRGQLQDTTLSARKSCSSAMPPKDTEKRPLAAGDLVVAGIATKTGQRAVGGARATATCPASTGARAARFPGAPARAS